MCVWLERVCVCGLSVWFSFQAVWVQTLHAVVDVCVVLLMSVLAVCSPSPAHVLSHVPFPTPLFPSGGSPSLCMTMSLSLSKGTVLLKTGASRSRRASRKGIGTGVNEPFINVFMF